MNTGPQRIPAGMMPETSRPSLELAWKDREAEAVLLTAGASRTMGLALRVYALEIRLKSIICRHLRLEYLPRSCKTHDLAELILYTGLWPQLDDPERGKLRANWDLLATFSKHRLNEARYCPAVTFLGPDEFSRLTGALDDPSDGVLPWLSRQP